MGKFLSKLLFNILFFFLEFVRQLVSLGSRVSLANRDGKTALHLAAMCNNLEAAQILIAHNAKVDAQDNQVSDIIFY